jgi:hypothetical protein
MEQDVTDFGLVHGAYHGSWCWKLVEDVLVKHGHRAFVVDLPSEDPLAGSNEYAKTIVEAFRSASDDLVLVGHSLAGLSAPLVPLLRPVRKLVLVSAMLPRPGRSQSEVHVDEPDMLLPGPTNATTRTGSGATFWKPDYAVQRFYADCTDPLARWAAAQLRGQCWKILHEKCPLTAWPKVHTSYILGAADPVVNPIWARRLVPAVLKEAPIELPIGHSSFLSAPELLTETLISLA